MTTQRDRHVRRSQTDYASAFADLLPNGFAWPRDPSSILMRLVNGLCGIFGFVDDRAADLLETESDPRKTVEILPEWERAWGLPDPCLLHPPTAVDLRQLALVAKMTMLGEQSRQFFIDQAAAIGISIVIREFSPFMCGVSNCGNTRTAATNGYPRWQVGDPKMRFSWVVKANATFLLWFHVGGGGYIQPDMEWRTGGQCGVDPMVRIGRNTELECILRRYKPAHTNLIFNYEQTPERPPSAHLRLVTYPPIIQQVDVGGKDLREDSSNALREDGSIELRE